MTHTTTTATELARLMLCIGSRLMPAVLPPDHDHESRDEGNAAHWLAEQMIQGTTPAIGSKAPNGFTITMDMMDHVSQYVSALDIGETEAETTFSGATWTVRARCDHLSYRDTTLTIDDFKYGWRLVEPNRNWTLLAHAIGYCIRHQVRPDRIILRIHQPRPFHSAGPLREWSCSFDELMGFYHQIDMRLTDPSEELVSGLARCAKCHALATCPAARRAGMNSIDATMLAFDESLPDHVLAYELETLEHAQQTIKHRVEALQELITHKITCGAVIDGYMLERRQGNRTWIKGMSGKVLSAATGIDLTKDDTVTPAEAERRGVDKSVITALTHRPALGTKLKRVDADTVARRMFGDKT